MLKFAPLEELLTKDKVSGTVQPNPLTEKATIGKGLTVMKADFISASTIPLPFVTTNVTVNVPAVLNACDGLTWVESAPSPKSQALETMALIPLVVEVFVKLTGTPTHTIKGFAVKLAVGVCAREKNVKASRNTASNKRMRIVGQFRYLH